MLQFLLPHTRGSSHGQTRIIRKAYEQDFYIPMMNQAYELWAQLEKEAGVKLYRWAETAVCERWLVSCGDFQMSTFF